VHRVLCLVDGFNLYHALDALGQPRLKWLDLRAVAQRLVLTRSERLERVVYFSAFATWRAHGSLQRHRDYVRALEAHGVSVVMGKFKEKDRHCNRCGSQWKAHEEKETDVNIAITLLREAQKDTFDRCLLVTRDSDLAPALRAVRADFPNKRLTVVAPPNYGHSTELVQAAHSKAKLTIAQLEQCQLPDSVLDPAGVLVASRPATFT
jgi:NYN domain